MLAYIGVGSNLGDALDNCHRAIQAITSDRRNRMVGCSPFYKTEPVGKKDQDWFVNGVIALGTELNPRELMDFLLATEKKMGRERGKRWGPRIIDLDILFYGDQVLDEPGLQIPHPRLHERRFVLVPLKDIAPYLEHPLLGKTVSQLLGDLGEGEKVIPLLEAGQKPCLVSFST
ncbi:MAG: 2-amino-4-hydroxy-6-hydroxymethyldihydropteridine diphosphokinase [Deltaproteobacteria bacterium RBG_19FT_COMBO_52_11]|nr:MAG: 2-amino-4-hydroxy-6-hydroxymethyldihydropteridine diphosphokinase [Deltaproteobacteria bacterium RBG_19FT_COMBO_52_11]